MGPTCRGLTINNPLTDLLEGELHVGGRLALQIFGRIVEAGFELKPRIGLNYLITDARRLISPVVV